MAKPGERRLHGQPKPSVHMLESYGAGCVIPLPILMPELPPAMPDPELLPMLPCPVFILDGPMEFETGMPCPDCPMLDA